MLAYFSGLDEVGQLVLPSGCEFQLDISNTPCFEVPASAPLDHDDIEFYRARVQQALEPYEDPQSWPRPVDRSGPQPDV